MASSFCRRRCFLRNWSPYCPIASKSGARVNVNPRIRTEYKGQYIYFANESAIKAFEADPEGAIALMSAEDQAAVKHNEICPYTGLKVESSHRTESQGKLFYFCCAHCKWEFGSVSSGWRTDEAFCLNRRCPFEHRLRLSDF